MEAGPHLRPALGDDDMTQDARFGLPLSLVEALQADSSPVARTLAELMEDAPPPSEPARRSAAMSWRVLFAGLSLAAAAGAQAHAAQPTLAGRWSMAPAQSRFVEAVTGPAPDAATWIVTRDDRDRLAYQLIETRRGARPVRATYDVAVADARSAAAGPALEVTAVRDAAGDVVIRAPPVDGLQALIRVRRTGRDTAVLEHAVQGAAGATEVERISLVRAPASAPTAR